MVEQTDVIDYVTSSEDGSCVSLTMLEERSLDTPGLLDQTMTKMNSYLVFMVSGRLEEVGPQASSAKIRVEYNVLDDPTSSPELMRILAAATAMFARRDVEFVVRHFDVLREGGLGSSRSVPEQGAVHPSDG